MQHAPIHMLAKRALGDKSSNDFNSFFNLPLTMRFLVCLAATVVAFHQAQPIGQLAFQESRALRGAFQGGEADEFESARRRLLDASTVQYGKGFWSKQASPNAPAVQADESDEPEKSDAKQAAKAAETQTKKAKTKTKKAKTKKAKTKKAKTKRNKTKKRRSKRNKTKRNKTKRNKTKRNKTKRNKTKKGKSKKGKSKI
ncbi:unnamed protein product [Aphanomyces euteiches]